MRAVMMLVSGALLGALVFPGQWIPAELRFDMASVFGTPAYRAPAATPEMSAGMTPIDTMCPEDLLGWRSAQTIEGVEIAAASTCSADNPYAIAAFVKGTNNVSMETLLRAGLTPDALEKGADLDGDGDPDEIHIRLEISELNGGSPDAQEPVAQYEIAPGITPGLWVFSPKSFGMATENFDSNIANALLRSPAPAIRVEQGDHIYITLENTHYMPHTIHLHGVDHAYRRADGQGNDGVPMSSELPVQPGEARTYEILPRSAGTAFYHCHVQPQSHILMGLQGMFIVEENRPNNTLQSMNIGAGEVRVRSQASRETYDQEYDLQYTDIDSGLNNIIQQTNDPARIEQWLHGGYNLSSAHSNYFTVNGRSFPYSFRESLVVTKGDERIRLRVLNAGTEGLALHTHGHKATVTHLDGHALPEQGQITRDVFWLASAQRMDLTLDTRNDGVHSYGSGVWMLHDHTGKGTTNDGIAPGGNMSAIVYRDYLAENGWPITQGEDMGMFFDPAFYRRGDRDSEPAVEMNAAFFLRLLALGFAVALLLTGFVSLLLPLARKSP
ncbi:MAG: multicopper oxidase domain-containing protein [Pseudomonadales bacterium]|nr:multicopper oxidase domain-containing protein [Pseudomonadales bacterium]